MARKFHSSDDTIVKTAEGLLQGFFLDDLYIFHGIKYADALRFQPPTAPQPWEGVRSASNYGYICPVSAEPMPTAEILIPHRFWPADENCQYLNIWTPSLDAGAKKPVMVWLHGGGFANGSSIEQVAYEGDALAKWGDAVVVTLNHRLNILGHLDMSSFGEKYANSVNAGIADIVEALRWIRRNIAAFGGDPDNVMLFGQSGGGGKISALLQTPAAAGLFHRAVLMSGIFAGGHGKPVDHRPFVLEMMKELNIPADQPEQLEKVPYVFLMRAYNKAALKIYRESKQMIDWGPVANGWYLGDPMEVGFSDFARTVPTMAGSVIAEFGMGPSVPGAESLTPAEKRALVAKRYGEEGDKVLALFEKAYPGKDVLLLNKLDIGARIATTQFIEEKSRVSSVPNYLYMFSLDFDVDGPRPAWHCSDIPFVFHNTARVPCANIEGVTDQLEAAVAHAWVAFARNGKPGWTPYTDEHRITMVFDRECRERDNYDRELIETLYRLTPPMSLGSMAIKRLEAAVNEQGGDWMY